jgi:hypothetical protein
VEDEVAVPVPVTDGEPLRDAVSVAVAVADDVAVPVPVTDGEPDGD